MSEGRTGHRKFRLTNRKNSERKKAARKKATLTSINVNAMEECPGEPSSLPLDLPITSYTNQTLLSLDVLSRRLHMMESINEGLHGYK